MRSLTPARLALLAAVVALVAFLPAVANGWALDDVGVIERNARAHGVGAALRGFFAPYWPTAGDRTAGLWRPLVILTYAVDWSLAGGRPWLAHLSNAAWHAVATGLLVLVAAAWFRGWPLLIAGLVFALHPVHVEAVANVVGRAELLAAVAVFGAILAARRHRAADGTPRAGWGCAVVAAVGLGLLVKEHAIVAVPLVALDGWLTRGRRRADPAVYLGLLVVAVGWLHLWRAVAGGYVLETVAAPFRGLGVAGRAGIMLPVVLDVVRLLCWPFTLAADYNPQLVRPEAAPTLAAVAGAILATALLALGLVAIRRAPAVAFGLLGAGIAWGPTSNLLVPSGIVLAERTLYLPSLVVALTAGWLAAAAVRLSPERRRLAVGAAVLLGVAWVARIETRIPFWHDTRSVVIEDYLQHPENYRAHARIGSVFEITGDTASALREFLVAAELWPGDYVLTLQTARAARAVGQATIAVAESRRGLALAPGDPVLAERLGATLAWAGRAEEARGILRAGMERHPRVALLVERYLAVLEAEDAPVWWIRLVRSRLEWLAARPAAAIEALREAAATLPDALPWEACEDLRSSGALARNLLLEEAVVLDMVRTASCSGN